MMKNQQRVAGMLKRAGCEIIRIAKPLVPIRINKHSIMCLAIPMKP